MVAITAPPHYISAGSLISADQIHDLITGQPVTDWAVIHLTAVFESCFRQPSILFARRDFSREKTYQLHFAQFLSSSTSIHLRRRACG